MRQDFGSWTCMVWAAENVRDHRRCILSRGELAEIVDAEAFFDIADFIDHPLEASLAKPPVLVNRSGRSH